MTPVVVALVAMAVTLAVTPLAIVLARRTGIVDRPGELKRQTASVPYLGGVAVFCGALVGASVGRPWLGVPLACALALGDADDRYDLSPWLRLAGEVGVGLLVAATCHVHLPPIVAWPLVVLVTVLLINGVNLLDGLDMLAGGVTAAAALGFALVLHGGGRDLAVALVGALAGFLVFNRPPARIYLGDGGAYLLGAALAVLTTLAWSGSVHRSTGVAALALVAVPVAEVTCAVIRRSRGGLSLLAGDRGHPYDRMVAHGRSALTASLSYIVLQALITVVAVVVVHVGSLGLAVVIDVVVAAVVLGAASLVGGLTPDAEVLP